MLQGAGVLLEMMPARKVAPPTVTSRWPSRESGSSYWEIW